MTDMTTGAQMAPQNVSGPAGASARGRTDGVRQGNSASGKLPTQLELLQELSRLYKIQPATALWRAVEIQEVLKLGLPEGTGLDLGCGDGALAGLILRHLETKPELIGLDYSEGEIAVSRRRGVYRDAICSSSDDMPLADASVDFVFSNSVLEHIPALEETIGEVARVLKTGGEMIATVPAPPFRALLGARGRTGEARASYLERMDARLGHHNYLDEAGWRDLCARHGLQLNLAKPYLNGAQVRRWERLSAMTGGVLQALGASNAMLYRLQRLTRSDDRSAGGLLQAEGKPPLWSRLWAKLVAGKVLRETDGSEQPGACLLVRAVKL